MKGLFSALVLLSVATPAFAEGLACEYSWRTISPDGLGVLLAPPGSRFQVSRTETWQLRDPLLGKTALAWHNGSGLGIEVRNPEGKVEFHLDTGWASTLVEVAAEGTLSPEQLRQWGYEPTGSHRITGITFSCAPVR